MKLCIARQVGWGMECPDVATWLSLLMCHLSKAGIDIDMQQITKGRIAMARNRAVEYARRSRSDYLLMIDPDIVADRYVSYGPDGTLQGDAKPFFQTATKLLLEQDGPAIAAAPYRGPPPHYPLHVFAVNKDGKRQRVSNKQSVDLHGWHRVEAVGTGLVLMPMSIFDKLDEKYGENALPYFHDVYSDRTQTALTYSQDVQFCLKCGDAGIPIYVNFDCWCGHWQNAVVEAPGREVPNTYAVRPEAESKQHTPCENTTTEQPRLPKSCETPSIEKCPTTYAKPLPSVTLLKSGS